MLRSACPKPLARDRFCRRPSTLLALAALACGLGLVASGCSGGGSKRTAAPEVATPLPADPAAALGELDRRIADAPKEVAPRVQRAELLESLGRFGEAAEEWRVVTRSRADGATKARAWMGRARSLDRVLGHVRVLEAGNTAGRETAEALLEAWGEVSDSDERTGLVGEVATLYRLGRFDQGMDRIRRAANRAKGFTAEKLLVLMFEERAGKPGITVVRSLDDFARSPDPSTRELATQQLIRLADSSEDPEIAHTAEGLLVRLTRESDAPVPSLVAWQSDRESGKETRLEFAHRQRAMRETEDALSRTRPMQAYRSLEPLLRDETTATPELVDLVNRCCAQLCALCVEKLENGSVENAGDVATAIRALPQSWLTGEHKDLARNALHRQQVAAVRERAKDTLAEANEAVDQQRPDDALNLVAPLLDKLPEELVPEVQTIRARALAQKGESADALRLLEKHGPFSDPVVQRLHGALLADAGRGDEAEVLLENLPLKYFNVEAFDALIVALANQAKWEKLIARLNTLGGQIPARYKPIRRKAVVGAANRLIDNLDPEGAIAFIRGNLAEDELLSPETGPILVRAYLSAGRTEEALGFLISDDHAVGDVPPDLVRELVNRAGGQLATEQRFQLLRRLPEWERDESTSTFLASNWPRYGTYLPKPGVYEATYLVRTLSEEGEVLTDDRKRAYYQWKNSYFLVDTIDGDKETWRVDGDLWVRSTALSEWWVPVQADENPPLPEVTSPDGVVAQLVEAGHTVKIRQQSYTGCIGVEIRLPDLGPDEKIRIDLAPEVGEIRWQRKIGRVIVESRELIDLTRTDGPSDEGGN